MKIVFFDGYCNLCNETVKWLLKFDRAHVLKFASLQGDTAKEYGVYAALGEDPDSILYLRDGERFEKSEAALKIFSDLGLAGRAPEMLLLIPEILRNAVYGMVAKTRYQLFGRRNSCRLPTEAERAYFLP